jgi:putative endonuclease
MFYTYVLLCDDGSFYTGSSSDADKRFITHQDGRGGRYTKLHKPTKLLYKEEFETKSQAVKREFQIKGWSHDKKIRILKLKV